MARPKNAPRLWFRTGMRDGVARKPSWLILDGSRQITTGYGDGEEDKARQFLKEYILKNYNGEWKPREAPVIDIMQQDGLIYFISTDEVSGYPVKIGFSTVSTFVARRHSLQTACPYKLTVLLTIPGTNLNEYDFHDLFFMDRMRGEWFRRTPGLLATIESLRAEAGSSTTAPIQPQQIEHERV